MATHTPGPWEVDFSDVLDGSVAINYTPKSGLTWLAFARVVIEVDDKPSETGKANALLIAAAPELLEFLKAFIEAEEESHREEQAHDPEGCRFCEGVAAIAKAEGKS
jgi:hypothetical protein